ncbi:MAG: hypothetical protein ACKOAR_04395 [Bacteroidota bacterium]
MRPLGASPYEPKQSEETLVAEDTVVFEQGHVYVHCHFQNGPSDSLVRIWRSTYLVPNGSPERSALIHAENISFAPQWTPMPRNREFRFLLIFEGLPRDCARFDLFEDIPEAGGFFVGDIARNSTDVYHVWLT